MYKNKKLKELMRGGATAFNFLFYRSGETAFLFWCIVAVRPFFCLGGGRREDREVRLGKNGERGWAEGKEKGLGG